MRHQPIEPSKGSRTPERRRRGAEARHGGQCMSFVVRVVRSEVGVRWAVEPLQNFVVMRMTVAIAMHSLGVLDGI